MTAERYAGGGKRRRPSGLNTMFAWFGDANLSYLAHARLHVAHPDWDFDRLTNYGSLFIGEETPVAYGDKTIGTNHILPTSRAARYTGGVWVGKFLKTCTYQRMTREASIETGEVTERQCVLENTLAHAITARLRIDRERCS